MIGQLLPNFNELEKKIVLAAQLYYQDGSSPYTDPEFDRMVKQLKDTKPTSPVLSLASYGYQLVNDTTPGERLPHRYGNVTSLGKAYCYKEVQKSLRDYIWASPKMDGMSVAMYYQAGCLVTALTRGDYVSGIDITKKVIPIVGPTIRDMFTGGVRGEIIMSQENYKKYCETHPDAKNARNTVAGIINSDGLSDDIKYLDIVVYTILGEDDTQCDEVPMEYVISFLDRNFEHVTPYKYLLGEELSEENYFQTMRQLKDGWDETLGYETDGVVVTHSVSVVDNKNYVYDSQAIKFESEQATSTVTDVEWAMSKTHYAIPRIKIEPVELDGATVTYATGYNAKYISDMGIVPGTVLKLSRHGDVIPNVDEIVSQPDPHYPGSSLPSMCPECGEELSWDGVHLKCTNPDCMNAVVQDTLAWINNLAPLDDFGDKLRLKFLHQTYKDDISIEHIMEDPEGMSRGNHLAVFGTIQSRRYGLMLQKIYLDSVTIVAALLALNIPRIGDVTVRKFAQFPQAIQEVYREVSEDCVDEEFLLNELSTKIGEANSKSILENISKFKRWKYIYDRIDWSSASGEQGKVAITGKLSVKRPVFEKELRDHGFIPGSITKDTRFLITDEPNSSSEKNKKADKWGIEKITEKDFRKRFF